MADAVTPFPTRLDPAAVVIPDERGYRVVIRGRPDLAAFEAVFGRLSLAHSHANTIARECGLDLTISSAALRKEVGL